MRRPQTAGMGLQRERRQNVAFTPETETLNVASVLPRVSRTSTSTSPPNAARLSMVEASRHRLSIRKSAAFPMQQTAPKMFLASCADITRHGRDWNAEFQLAWEMEDNTMSQAESRAETLRQVEREFVNEAVTKVKQIVTLDDNGPRELPKFLHCYRVDNIFFRVLPDSRSGRNYVASLRGVLQSRTRLLTVPLSCMFFYRGMPVLAQALVPMPPQPTRLYGAGSTDDPEVEAEIALMAEALNIPFPDATLEVYEGLDGRFYMTNSNSTLTPLFTGDTIMKRQEMLRMCVHVTEGHEDTLSVLDSVEVQDAIVRACMDSKQRPIPECLRNVGELLHGYGVNMCLLKQALQKINSVGRFDARSVKHVNELLCIEMIARSVKQEFYVEVQGKRIAYDDEVLAATLSKQMGEAFAPRNIFLSRFLEVVAKKYGIVDEDEDLIQLLTELRVRRKADVVARICTLVGVTIEKSEQTRMTWHATVNARVLPRLMDPRVVRSLAEGYETVSTQDSHRYAFCWPIRWKVACWEGRYDEALDLVHETALSLRKHEGKVAIPPLYAKRSVCEVCFATMQKNCISEGRSLFPGVMKSFEELTCPMTQGRRHIEYGFWLLRVALVYHPEDLVTYRSCVEEAAEHFYSAIAKLPAYLRSEHGAWLHLQPYKGLLQCKRMLPSCSVNTRALVEHSIELSTIGWASDFFTLFLWDLALQLEAEGLYEDAIRVILTAITVSKKKPTVSLNLPTLLVDAAHIYRSWDEEKYSEHCLTLMREAADKAGEIFGVRSREFAVVMNNKGAVEIDLNRLHDARESLKKSGFAFREAGVPKDDSDYLAYLANLVHLEQRATARPKVRRGFLRRYPFLSSGKEEFPFADIRPLEDNTFVNLARQRVSMENNTEEAKQIEHAMKERVWELLRALQEGDILRRYPFLPATIHDVLTASLHLDDDKDFGDLAAKLPLCEGDTQVRELRQVICDYVVQKAERTALQRSYLDRLEHEFNEAHGEYVNLMIPIPWLFVIEDESFNALHDRLQKLIENSASPTKLQGIRELMGQRVAQLEEETFNRREEIQPWLPVSKLYSIPIGGLWHDQHLRDMVREYRMATQQNASRDELEERWYYIEAKLDALWERENITSMSRAVEDEEFHRRFPFLPERPHQQRLSSLGLYEDTAIAGLVTKLSKLENDARLQADLLVAVRNIAARHRDAKELKKWYYDLDSISSGIISLENVPKRRDDYYVELWQRRNIERAECGEDAAQVVARTHQMENRLEQIHSLMRKVVCHGYRRRQHLESSYPFLSRWYSGYAVETLGIEDDDEFLALAEQRRQLLASPDTSLDAIRRADEQAKRRVAKLASNRAKRQEQFTKMYPFLPDRIDGTETSALQLEDNEAFMQKAAQHARLLSSSSGENDTRQRRLERELENLAVAIAREGMIREWRAAVDFEDLRERYPFLPTEPAPGVALSDVRPTQNVTFRTLSNRLDEERRGGPSNTNVIRATEEEMAKLVVHLAEERAAAAVAVRAQFPFLPRRVLGVPLTDLPLREDEMFAAATTSPGGAQGMGTPLMARALQLAMHYHLSEAQLADGDDAVLAHHPYLIYTARKCFPLRHLPLDDDTIFNERLRNYVELMRQTDVDEDDAAVTRLLLAKRADELALAECEKIERIRKTFVALQPLSFEDLLHLQDRREFQGFNEQEQDSVASPVQLKEAKQFILDDREARAAKMREVDALRKAYPMLGRDIEPSMLQDPVIAQIVGEHDELIGGAAVTVDDLGKLEEEMAQRVGVYKAHYKTEPHSPKTPADDVHSPFGLLEQDLADDAYYAQLAAQLTTLEDSNDPTDIPSINRTKALMEIRREQLQRDLNLLETHKQHAVERATERYPFLSHKIHGIPLVDLHLEEDDEALELEEQRRQCISRGESTTEVDKVLNDRARCIAQAIHTDESMISNALPFLGRSVRGVPLRELEISTDPHFAELTIQYPNTADEAERARLEQQMRDQAGRIAREHRAARRFKGARAEDLRERYPFLPTEPAPGVALSDVRPTQNVTFRTLSNRLDEERRGGPSNTNVIRATEEEMAKLVVHLAEERAAAAVAVRAQFPFLPRRVLGVPLTDLPLREDEMLAQLLRRRARQLRQRSTSDANATEEEMLRRVETLARAFRQADAFRRDGTEYVRARNPFLAYEDRKGVLLNEIPFPSDAPYQQLFRERLVALEEGEVDTVLLTRLETELCERADELALGESRRLNDLLERYPFLVPQNVPGWLEELMRDADFQRMCARYDELNADPEKNAAALQELGDSMCAKSDAAAAALRTAETTEGAEQERLRALYPMCPDVTAAAVADSGMQKLVDRRASLSEQFEKNSEVIALLDKEVIRRSSLLTLSCEEDGIEICEESEVLPFTVTFRRRVARRRRTHFVTPNDKDSLDKVIARLKGQDGNDGDDAQLPSNMDTHANEENTGNSAPLHQQKDSAESRGSMSQEAQQRKDTADVLPYAGAQVKEGEYMEHTADNESSTGVPLQPHHLTSGDSTKRGLATSSQEDGNDTGMPITSSAGQDSETNAERMHDMAALNGVSMTSPHSTANGSKHGGLAASSHTEGNGIEGEEASRGNVSNPALLNLRASQNEIEEESERLGRSSIVDEEALQRGVVCNDELVAKNHHYVEMFADEEALVRSRLIQCEVEESKMLLLMNEVIHEETMNRISIDKQYTNECIPLTSLRDQETRRLHLLADELAKMFHEESRARLAISDEEIREMNQIELNAEDREIELERARRQQKQQLKLLEKEESRGREVVEFDEKEGLDDLSNNLQKNLRAAQERKESLDRAIVELIGAETDKRRRIEISEKTDQQMLGNTLQEMAHRAKRMQESREASEATARAQQSEKDAAKLIKRVVRGYIVRTRLGNRFSNRKMQERKNAVEGVFRNEFTARSAIAEGERKNREELEVKRGPRVLQHISLNKSLSELEKEEDDARHQLFDDIMFQMQNLQRVFRKILAKQQQTTPSLQRLQEFEDREDKNKGTTVEGVSPTSKEGTTLLVSDDNDADSDEDDDPIGTGKYKGYALDPIGAFLLQYERDLRRFRASLKTNRQTVAADHDFLKKARDGATQEIVQGGTGALWVPTRPLPLSDLVRGPSAQYRRGRITDSRGVRPSSRMSDVDGRATTPSDAPALDGLVRQNRLY